MSKVYVLAKEWVSPFMSFPSGTEWVKEKGMSYYYPTTGRKILIPENDIINSPEWFILKEESIVEGTLSGKEAFDTGYRMGVKDSYKYNPKKYTEKELLDAEMKAFNESRLTHPMVGFKYDTFSDYKNKTT